jgi:hypothetical protein
VPVASKIATATATSPYPAGATKPPRPLVLSAAVQPGTGNRLATSAAAQLGDCLGPCQAGQDQRHQLGHEASLHLAGSCTLEIKAPGRARLGIVCYWPVHRFPAVTYGLGLILCH